MSGPREEFEAWATEDGLCLIRGTSGYSSFSTGAAWRAWVASVGLEREKARVAGRDVDEARLGMEPP